MAAVERTHIVVSTPWSGSWRLCNLMGRTGTMPTPQPWFVPLGAPPVAREVDGASDDRPWAARYVAAVRERATEAGVCTFSMMWTHQRFLLQIARLALGPDPDARAMLDPDVVAACFPGPSYVWVRSSDFSGQALRWYASRHRGLAHADDLEADAATGAVDFQEVRWLEALARRQEQGWATYFAIHGIEPVVVSTEQLGEEPVALALEVVRRLGHEPTQQPTSKGSNEEIEAVARVLAGPYMRARRRLSSVVGVRARTA